MPANKLTLIEDALKARLTLYADATGTPVAWEDVSYSPTLGQTYLQPVFMPNRTGVITLGDTGPQYHFGLYSISVHGKQGQGSRVNSLVADAIIEHFPPGLVIAHGGIQLSIGSTDGSPGVPWRSGAIRNGVTTMIVVSVPWWIDL